jgi:hypothetical protein
MRSSFLMAVAVLAIPVSWAIAQTAPSATPQSGPPSATVPVPRAAGVGLVGKRLTCRQDMGAKGLRGQDLRDQTQLCVAQGQLDCLKQAIDQKIVGPQRKDFIKTCMGVASAASDE